MNRFLFLKNVLLIVFLLSILTLTNSGYGQGVFGGKIAVMDDASSVIWWNTNSQTCDGAGTGNLSVGNATTYNVYLGDRFYMGGNVLTFGFPSSNDGAFLQWRYYIVGGTAPAWSSALTLPYANNTVCGGGSNKKYEYIPVLGSNIVQCTSVGDFRLDVNLVGYQNSINYSQFVSGNYIPFTVSALSNPTSSAISCGSAAGEISLSWTKWNLRDVVIVRNTTGTFTGCEPVNGTTYNAGNTIGTGANQATVVYRGSATSFTDTDLNGGTTYYYKIYSENYSYYSSGTSTLNATTFGLWTGATSTDWHTTTNWSCNTVPTSTTDVIIPSGAPRYPVISTSDAVAKSISLSASGTSLTMNTAKKLTLSGNFSLAAGSTFDAGDGTVIFNSAATITGTVIFFKVEIGGGGVAFNSNCTIGNGTNAASLTINAGGFVSTVCPNYATGSTLIYNTGASTFNRGNEWTSDTGEQPYHVRVNAGSTLNMDVSASYDGESRSMRGDLDLYGTLTMRGNSGTMAEDIIVGGGVTIRATGTLVLGCQKPEEAKIGDIQLGGDWLHLAGGVFNPSQRAVIFTGSNNDQTVTFSGTENFAYFVVNKSGNGTVRLNCPILIFGTNRGNPLQLLNGNLDMNGNNITFRIYDASDINNLVDHNIAIDGTAGNLTRQIINTSATQAIFDMTHSDAAEHTTTITRNSANASLLSFGSNIIVQIGSTTGSGNAGINFGSAFTTINGTLRINPRGFVRINPPTYASNSLLQYNVAGEYRRSVEWSAATTAVPGYPFHVQTSATTNFIAGGNSNESTVLNMAGSLTIDANTTFDMSNGGSNDMTVPLTVGLDINNAGTLLASQNIGGNIILGRSWSRTGAGVFTHYNRSVTFNTSTDGTLTAPGAGESFYELIINKSGTGTIGTNYVGYRVTLNSPVVVTNIFTLTSGYFVTNSTNLLTLNSLASSSGGAVETFVSGPMRKLGSNNFSFPVGMITNTGAQEQFHYRPIAISNLGTTTDYTAEFFRANPYDQGDISLPAKNAGLQLISRCEYWNLTRASGGTTPITVTPSWSTYTYWSSKCNLTDPYVNNSSALRVVPYNGSNPATGSTANKWGDVDFGQSGVGTGNQSYIQTVSWNGALNYNKFVLGSSDWRLAPLPFKILDFNVKSKSNQSNIQWVVNDETEVKSYVIERSTDGINFKSILNTSSRYSSNTTSYQRYDENPVNGWNYYRLKVIDHEGKIQYSSIQKVWFSGNMQITLLPNPASSILNVYLPEPEKVLGISIFNATGQRMREIKNVRGNEAIDVAAYPNGQYMLRVISIDGVKAYPFVKQ